MRKIFAFITAVIFSFTAITCAGAVNGASEYSRQAGVLAALGIIDGYSEELFQPSRALTRGEFVVMADRLVNIKPSGANALVFGDVSPEHPLFGALSAAVENGLISGVGGGLFNSDGVITLEQAVKIIVTALGYFIPAQSKGGYPAGFMAVGADIGLFKSISAASAELTLGNAVSLIYNALDAKVMLQTSYGYNAEYAKNEKNALELWHSIFKARGRVTETCYSGIYDESGLVKETQIKIASAKYGETIYNIDKSLNVIDLLGRNVEFCFKLNEDDSLELIYADSASEETEIRINSDDISGEVDGVIEYRIDDSGKTRTAKAQKAAVIYNFAAVKDRSELPASGSIFIPNNGYLTLIDNDGDGVYDVAKIVDYDNFVIGGIDYYKYIIYDKYISGKSVELDQKSNDIKVIIRDLNGGEIDFSDITAMDIVSVARSRNGKLIVAAVSGTGLRGTVNEVGDDYITVENERHKYAPNLINAFDNQIITPPEVGGYAIFYLDVNGHIAAVEKEVSTGWKLGYIIKAVSSGLDNHKIKLLSEDGKIEIMKLAEKITVSALGGSVSAADFVSDTTMKNRLVLYKTLNGEFKSVITAKKDNDTGSLIWSFDSTDSLKYKTSVLTFGGKVNISPSTKVFTVPAKDLSENADDERDWKVRDYKYFKDNQNYTVEGYSTIKNALIMDAVVQYRPLAGPNSEDVDEDARLAIVEKIADGLDNDGATLKKLYLVMNGQPVSYFVENGLNLSSLGKGDIIRIATNTAGHIVTIKNVFYASVKALALESEGGGTAGVDDIFHTFYGKVTKKDRTVIQVQSSVSASVIENHVTNRGPIIVCDLRNPQSIKVEIGSANEILDEATSGADASDVLIQSRYSETRAIIVFKY